MARSAAWREAWARAGRRPAVAIQHRARSRNLRPRLGERGIQRDGALVEGKRLAQARRILHGHAPGDLLAAEKLVVRREILRGPLLESLRLVRLEHDAELLGDARGDVRLHLEDVGQRRVERLLPLRSGRLGARDLDELRRHVHATLSAGLVPANRGGEQVSHAELGGDLLRRLGRLAVRRRASAGDHLQPRQERQLPAHFVRDPIREVLVLGRSQVLEREYGEPRDRRSGRSTRLPGAPRPHEERGADDGGQRDGAPGQRGSA